eukprot:CAMPEP_0179161480 /NCGR_PEP_ID=MMETSP0796-20121207/79054_1 /TAXON_ID=73915 /ORGANISM="Pyrodinium bahamense, Strain pbaha01" /LENGTH=65 /DNA_ID=CAMNT_0020863597 /DNA_START=72 /DNA_END=265 /DNA_ORIENTATION=+
MAPGALSLAGHGLIHGPAPRPFATAAVAGHAGGQASVPVLGPWQGAAARPVTAQAAAGAAGLAAL